MVRNFRILPVTCLIACLVTIPWTNALASERPVSTITPADVRPIAESLRASAAFAPVPTQYALLSRSRQSVAATNESKLLLGVVSGALIVGGMAMLAYGATSTCKGLHGDAGLTNSCDKKAVIGAAGLSGGSVMLVLWALSRS